VESTGSVKPWQPLPPGRREKVPNPAAILRDYKIQAYVSIPLFLPFRRYAPLVMDISFFHEDDDRLVETLDRVRDFTLAFRADNLWPAGSQLLETPEAELPEAGAGAQDPWAVFQKQWLL